MKSTIEQELIAARDTSHDNKRFVQNTLEAVKRQETKGTFTTVIRGAKTPKASKIILMLRRFPRYAGLTVAVAGIIATGGIGYAVHNWFGTDVGTSINDNIITVTAKDCPPSLLQQYRQTYHTNISTTYKIVRPDLVSKQDIKNAQLVNCEQRAITGLAQKAFPTSFTPGDSHKGMFYPATSYGTVESVDGTHITITDVPLNWSKGVAERVVVTLTTSPDTTVISGGQAVPLATFKKHDKVFFAFQNSTTDHDNDTRQHPQSDSHILTISKTQYDYKAKDIVDKSASQGAFTIEASTDEFPG